MDKDNKDYTNYQYIKGTSIKIPLEPLKFVYPKWIEAIPIKKVREFVEKLYWRYGE